MANFNVSYERIVSLSTQIEADSVHDARTIFWEKSDAGEMGMDLVNGAWVAKKGSEIDDISSSDFANVEKAR
jgi:hypothetical protein